MFQARRHRPTNQINIETNNKIESEWKNLIKNIIDTKTLILIQSKAEDTRIKQREQEVNLHFRP